MNSTRNDILQVSKDIFREKGYSGAGIQLILKKTGVPRGSLYHHFPMGKQELALEVLRLVCQEKSDQFKKAIYRKNVDDALRSIVQIFIDDLLSTKFKYACPILALSLSGGGNESNLEQAGADTFKSWENQLVHFMEKRKIDRPSQKASLFLSALDGAFVISKIYKNTDRLTTLQNNIHLFT